jgi:hypothetical protein
VGEGVEEEEEEEGVHRVRVEVEMVRSSNVRIIVTTNVY